MKNDIKNFLLACVLAFITLLIPSLLAGQEFYILVSLGIVALLMLRLEWTIDNLIFYIAVVVSGPLAQLIAMHFGIWHYKTAMFLSVPMWLPLVWGNFGLYIVRLKSFVSSFV